MHFFRESEHSTILISVLMHLLVLGLLAFNFDWFTTTKNLPAYKVIDAVIVDASVLQGKPEARRIESVPEPEQAMQAEQRRMMEEQKKQAEQAEVIRLQKTEAEKAQKIKNQKAAEEKKKREQKRHADEKAAAEKKLVEQQRLQEEEEAARRTQELQAAIAREEGEQQVVQLRVQYNLAIQQKISRNWIKPRVVTENLACKVRVQQIPGGDVVNVQIAQCDGDAFFQRSVENAVHKASPLPYDGFESVFDRNIEFDFKP